MPSERSDNFDATSPPSPDAALSSQHRLRGIGELFSSAWSIVRTRGIVIVAIAFSIWALFAVIAALLVNAFVDVPRLTTLYSNLTEVSSINFLQPTDLEKDWNALIGGEWLTYGWAGSGALLVALVFMYLLCTATASIAVTEQSYLWLEQGRKASFAKSIMRGVGRAAPGTFVLGIYYLAVVTVLVLGSALGAAAAYGLLSATIGTDNGSAEVIAILGGITLGFLASIAIVIWIYTIWSVSPYAVTLSSEPWSALKQSQRLTKGNRLDVFIRILVVTICVAIALSVVTIPVDLLLGLVPLTLGGLGPLLVILYIRAAISALSPLITTASLLTMYVDLGGDASGISAKE